MGPNDRSNAAWSSASRTETATHPSSASYTPSTSASSDWLPVPPRHRAGRRGGDDLLGGDGRHHLDLGHLDELALTGPVAVAEGGLQGDGRVHADDRVGEAHRG